MKKRKFVKWKHVKKDECKVHTLWLEATVKVRYIRQFREYRDMEKLKDIDFNGYWPMIPEGEILPGTKVRLLKVIETKKEKF